LSIGCCSRCLFAVLRFYFGFVADSVLLLVVVAEMMKMMMTSLVYSSYSFEPALLSCC
jgi:hypothetical protein